MSEIHMGDVGTVIRVTVTENDDAVDLSGANNYDLIFKKPTSDTTVTEDATFTTDGTDGQIEFTVPDNTWLDEVGWWRVQALVEWASGNRWFGEIGRFRVFPNL